jgi:hypothetical protein
MTLPLVTPLTGVVSAATAVVCQETIYDGATDAFESNDTVLEDTAGSITFALEVYLDSTIASLAVPVSNYNTSGGGIQMLYINTTDIMILSARGTDGATAPEISMSGKKDQWVKLIGVYDPSGAAKSTIWLDGVQGTEIAISGTAVGVGNGFTIGRTNKSSIRWWKGKLRNIEYYNGAPTDATTWVPGDTSSMAGVTLVAQFEKGNDENDQGYGFTTIGTPTTQDCA